MDLRDAVRVCHAFCNAWLFRHRFLEKIVSAELGFPKGFTFENHSDTRSLMGKRDQPEPAIDSPDQNRQRAVNSFRPPHSIVMSKDRQLSKMLVSLLDVELPSENRSTSAGVDNVTCPGRISGAIGSHRQVDAVVRKLYCFNRSLFVHFRSRFGRMIEQKLVEITACDLVRVIGLRTITVLKIKFCSTVGACTHDFAAVLF